MSTLTSHEQELFDAARGAVPKFFFAKDGVPAEIFAAAAKAFGLARTQIDSWLGMALIGTATGFWLDQHAVDRNIRRQSGEVDATLSARIRRVDDAVTLPALASKVNAILSAAAVSGTGAIVEMRQNALHFKKPFWAQLLVPDPANINTGDHFSVTNGTATQIYEFTRGGAAGGGHIAVNISTALVAEDVATILVAAFIANPISGGGYGYGVSSTNARIVQFANLSSFPQIQINLSGITGKGFAFSYPRPTIGRGWRIAGAGTGVKANEFIVILPYGTSTATSKAVSDMLRQFKAGGVRFQVEVRRIP